MNEDATGVVVPCIEVSRCIECKACERICPALNPPAYNEPRTAYAAWSTDNEVRRTAASGGIASAINKYVAFKDGLAIGAVLDGDFRVKIVPCNINNRDSVRNSKYSFSDSQDIYPLLRQALREKRFVAIIGLPCQIAGYRKYIGEHDNVVYVDLVCHGVAPNSYLRQHVKSLEIQLGSEACGLSFRAPEKGTANYFFTLYNNKGEIFYSKRSADGEKYNIAFHRSYSYRESCYHCHYARRERCSDITIGDYHGLGQLETCGFSDENVSMILVNTPKGETLVSQLAEKEFIEIYPRPLEEPIKGDLQLQRPTPKPRERYDFEKYILKYNGDFEATVDKVLSLKNNRERMAFMKRLPRCIVRSVLNKLKAR